MTTAVESPLLTTAELASLLRRSLFSVKLDRKRGAIGPAEIRIAGSRLIRYRAAEVAEWIAAGCPPRAEWEARQTRQTQRPTRSAK